MFEPLDRMRAGHMPVLREVGPFGVGSEFDERPARAPVRPSGKDHGIATFELRFSHDSQLYHLGEAGIWVREARGGSILVRVFLQGKALAVCM